MGAQRALGRRQRTPEELDAILVALVDKLTRRMRTARRTCRTVVLRMRFADYTRATRSHTLPECTEDTATVLAVARGLLAAATPRIGTDGLTLIGITLTNLTRDGAIQLMLPLGNGPPHGLDAALDDVRGRFGSKAVTRAVLLGRDEGTQVPLLPD